MPSEDRDETRRCDCGCKRRATLHVFEHDLSFAPKCAQKWLDAEKQLNAEKFQDLPEDGTSRAI